MPKKNENNMDRLLTHVAKLVRSPENLATEALVFILQQSAAARRGLGEFLSTHLRLDGLAQLSFSSQAHERDGGIPDVAGADASGVTRLFIEAKFWAGLTDHQPTSYLERLDEGGALVFVVPAVRSKLAWRELVARLDAKGMGSTPTEDAGSYALSIDGEADDDAVTEE